MEGQPKIIARAIIEMLGNDKDHLKKTMNTYVETLKGEQNINVLNADISEPDEQKGLHSVFTEIEAEFVTPLTFLMFCFDSMPSSVDIIEPNDLKFRSENFGSFMNDLLAKIHGINQNFTKVKAQADLVDSNAMNILQNFLMYLVRNGVHSAEMMSKPVGMKPQAVKAFLEEMEKKGLVKKDGDLYSRA